MAGAFWTWSFEPKVRSGVRSFVRSATAHLARLRSRRCWDEGLSVPDYPPPTLLMRWGGGRVVGHTELGGERRKRRRACEAFGRGDGGH